MKTLHEPECPHALDIPEYLMGHLPEDRRSCMEEHLRQCATCAKIAVGFGDVLVRLQEANANRLSSDIALCVRGGAAAKRRWSCPQPAWRAVWWQWTAALFLLGVALWTAHACSRSARLVVARQQNEAVGAARLWLEQTQEPDGSWDGSRWGAQKQYRSGLSALALLACIAATPRDQWLYTQPLVERGANYLLSEQQTDGRFGPFGSCTPYNHALCTLALLEAQVRTPRAEWKDALERALVYIINGQRASGAWGYPRRASDEGNSSITIWNIRVLQRAQALGWDLAREPLERAYSWLQANVDRTGRVGYRRANDFPFGHEALTAGALLCAWEDESARRHMPIDKMLRIVQAVPPADTHSVNYYTAYFLTRALSAVTESSAQEKADQWRNALVQHQEREGQYRGSCRPRDPWSAAGGRIYATAMAVLAMTPE